MEQNIFINLQNAAAPFSPRANRDGGYVIGCRTRERLCGKASDSFFKALGSERSLQNVSLFGNVAHRKPQNSQFVDDISYLFVLGVGLNHEAQIDLRLELLQGEICERHAVPAVDVLVLVLCRSVYYQEAVEIHQDAAASSPLALAVILGCRKDGKYLNNNGEQYQFNLTSCSYNK